ncbi:DNA-processing protein DprA [Chryseobacterium arthrosphaerae]|uniref:DNA-processing protein DprA n=1 Tax=Chryseobacterium arthrosphaerae TaxID=651561 RepID=UPI003D33FB52
MKFTENALNVITTKSFKGIGRSWIKKYIRGNEDVHKIVSLINEHSKQEDIIKEDFFNYKKNEIFNEISLLNTSCDGLTAIGDDDFPTVRGNVKDGDYPIFLFYKGNLNLLNYINVNIAVIGLLNPTESIVKREKKLVREFVNNNCTIVSGLALGCDTVAHKESLNKGKSIAILPNHLGKITPASNKGLADEILKSGGLLITEYYNDFNSARELSSRYKDRDRLQALYSDAVILAASYSPESGKNWNLLGKLDSGARLAMEFASEYNIHIAVMYDDNLDFENPMFDLNRKLLKDNKKTILLKQKNLQDLITKIKISKKNNTYQTFLFE